MTQRLRTSRSRDRLAIWRLTHPGLRPGWSLVGLLLVVALVGVAETVQARTGASSAPVILLVVSSCATLVVSALVGVLHRAVVPLWVALVISSVAYDWAGDLAGGPLSGPFGYRNAFGALLLQGALAWLIGGFALRRRMVAVLAFLPAGLLGFLAVRSSSATAAGVALVAVAGLTLLGVRGARAAVIVCGLATAAVLAGTMWLGATYESGGPVTGLAATIADAGITERRLALWHDALTIADDHPSGIGHDRFGEVSPTALADPDAVHAHNEYLEQGAELGWIGMVLMVVLVGWAFARLAIVPGADVVTALSAVALAGIAIHASVDYVWHFPAIPLAAAALVGTGIVPSHGRRAR